MQLTIKNGRTNLRELNQIIMIFDVQYAGKWVATKGNSVVDSAATLNKLTNKVKDRKDNTKLIYTLIPKGLIAGSV